MNKFYILLLLLVCLGALSKQQQCGPHQIYKTCGSACPPVCNTPPHMVCPAICIRGCFCAKGYVLISYKSRLCIRPDQCLTIR